ncbi:hypothetical protein AB1Y20_006575 [Prymnesium parvum]|uniref:Uncharacterized protein n=1 Tax=Prymnesium parvum TaxID=97485 RepID=A0AB34J017_PRYPA
MVGFICSVRSERDAHGGHAPHRARKRQMEWRGAAAGAAGTGRWQHCRQHAEPSSSWAVQPSRAPAQEQSHMPRNRRETAPARQSKVVNKRRGTAALPLHSEYPYQ